MDENYKFFHLDGQPIIIDDYATNMEVIDYISAFNSLRRSVNSKYVCNPTNIDIYACVNGKDLFIEKVKQYI